MQQQLEAANVEINELKQAGATSSNFPNREVAGSALQAPISGPMRGKGIKQSAERADKTSGAFYGGFIDQSDIVDKRVEQLSKEKRELIAKNLEESKEKMELSQKLNQSEKEMAALKSKLTKVTLDKERLERKMALGLDKSKSLAVQDENTPNFADSNF
jgi:septal ring factor EnvC (AmiA/AmiB activator)